LKNYLKFILNCQWIPEDKLKSSAIKEPLCQQKIHKKILDKGLPEDVMPGVKNAKVGFF
jgi:hypothetical protein